MQTLGNLPYLPRTKSTNYHICYLGGVNIGNVLRRRNYAVGIRVLTGLSGMLAVPLNLDENLKNRPHYYQAVDNTAFCSIP